MSTLMTQADFYAAYRHTAAAGDVSESGRRLMNLLANRGRQTKPAIMEWLGWSERKIRKEAELLRRVGIPLLASSGNGAGYWLSTSVAEIDEYISHEIESRTASLLEQEAALLGLVGRMRR